MTTVDDVLASAASGDDTAVVARRGRLVVTERAAQHLVQGAAERAALGTRDVDVSITRLDDDGLSAEIRLTIEYPRDALTATLARFRRDVVTRVEGLLGRPVNRLDVMVTDLVVELGRQRRVQ